MLVMHTTKKKKKTNFICIVREPTMNSVNNFMTSTKAINVKPKENENKIYSK